MHERLELRGVIVVVVRDDDPVDPARIQIDAERAHPRDDVLRTDARLDEQPRVLRLDEQRVSARTRSEDVDLHLYWAGSVGSFGNASAWSE